MTHRWYYRVGEQVTGPLDFDVLQSLATRGVLKTDHEVRGSRSQEWLRAGGVPKLFPQAATTEDLDAMLADARPVAMDELSAMLADAPARPAAVVRRDRPPHTQCFCRIRGRVEGPMTFEEVGRLARLGGLSPRDEVRLSDDADWIEAGHIVGLFDSPAEHEPGRPVVRTSWHEQPTSHDPGKSDVIPLRPHTARAPKSPDNFTPQSKPAPADRTFSNAYGEIVNEQTWYAKLHGLEIGPLTFDEVFELAGSGRMTRRDQLRDGLCRRWVAAGSIVGLFPDERLAPTDAQQTRSATPRLKVGPSGPRPASGPVPGPHQRRPKSKGAAATAAADADADAAAMKFLGVQNANAPSAAAPPTPTQESVPAPRPSIPVSEPSAVPIPTPVPRAALRHRPPPPRRQLRTEPRLPEIMIERKHIIVVASLLVVGAGWFFGTRFFRTEAPPVVEGPDTFPFVQCQVKMGGESVEWANIMFDDPEHPTRKVIGFYDGERDIYRFTTRNGATEMSGVPQGTYTVVIKPGRQTRVKIPTKYGDPKTSALTVSIQEGQNVLPPFELTP